MLSSTIALQPWCGGGGSGGVKSAGGPTMPRAIAGAGTLLWGRAARGVALGARTGAGRALGTPTGFSSMSNCATRLSRDGLPRNSAVAPSGAAAVEAALT